MATELHRRAASILIVHVGVQSIERADPSDSLAVGGVLVAVCEDQSETPSRLIGHIELHAGEPSEIAADAAYGQRLAFSVRLTQASGGRPPQRPVPVPRPGHPR